MSREQTVTLFLCGDVMTGRGIDQVLPDPVRPRLHEPYVRSAEQYVELAMEVNGPFPRRVAPDYIWGDALAELEHFSPAARIVNLETAVTRADDYWRGKGIHYRMSPENAACLEAAGIDCCTLANNHVLDWGYEGLEETLDTLARLDVAAVGAGPDVRRARAPAKLAPGDGARVSVIGLGHRTSGIPPEWAATPSRPGVDLLEDLSAGAVKRIAEQFGQAGAAGGIRVASIHWGGNWGYEIPAEFQRFARALVDDAGVDIVHGHSSHHVKGIEVYRNRLILYGCGDLLTDYEGISGFEEFRGDLGLMYFASLDAGDGRLLSLTMTPTQMRRFRVERAGQAGREWLARVLEREGAPLGTGVEVDASGRLVLGWGA